MKKLSIKKLMTVVIVGVFGMTAVGCGSNSSGESKDKLTQIKENGKLVVGMSADYAPYEYHALIDGEDKIVGFDVDIAQAIADDMGVKLELKEMNFDSLCESVQLGKIDMTISGMTPKPDREKAVDFSDIYYKAEQAFLVQASNKDTYKTLADLEGKKIGAQMGSIQADIAEGIKDADVKLLADVNTLILELKNGNIDALIVEAPVANLATTTNSDLAVGEEIIEDSEGGSAIGMPKDSPELVAQVNSTLKKLVDEGKIDEFVQKAVEQVKNQVE
ncbi:Arginine-binding extracellular protein ArtP precursor [uncultured Clostridium sp.]|uniref:transporter substrate-binding domain-containing protein n=1 Tax=uncultured Clostridium sp. TaxID=59620 RepID=UPI00082128DF|nr:transporter substrate-binding domain-containing protein [uncultured Clostridium sp.]SCJ33534.1 Arginine-binding extracellular protein ArtP precursor [uncultured Clostridium sp.]